MAQLDIDLTDPKAAREVLTKAIREKKKADAETEAKRERAVVNARLGAYELARTYHTYKRLTFAKYSVGHPLFEKLVAKPPEDRANEYARYIECPVGMVLFDFLNLEVKSVFVSALGIRAVIVRDHNIGRDRLLAIGTDEDLVSIADVFFVPVDVDADKPEPTTEKK